MSFGIRKMFVSDADGSGIIPVPLAPTTEGETAQGFFLNDWNTKGLRYSPPNLCKFDKVYLSKSMIKCLNSHVDGSKMADDVHEVIMSILLKAQMKQQDKGQVF